MPTAQQRPWWETNPWWTQPLNPNDPTTYPGVKPVAGLLGGTQGGPNWAPVLSPTIAPVVGLWDAAAKGMAGALGNTLSGLTRNPIQVAPVTSPTKDTPKTWGFKPGAAPTPLNYTGITGPAANIIGPESQFNSNAQNPRSTAGGLGQFIDTTWMDKDLRKRAGFEGIEDSAWMKLKKGKDGEAAQIAMTNAYAQRNTEVWQKKVGTAPNQGQLYGMHFLDAEPFISLTAMAQMKPDIDGTKLFPAAAASNPEVFYHDPKTRKQPRTASELYAEITRRGGGSVGGAGGTGTDPFNFPKLPRMDAGVVNQMPMPSPPQHVSLPTPPMRLPLPEAPAHEELPTDKWMAALKEFAPEAFNEKEANKGRLGAVIAGIASGAANVDARQGAGAVLAAMGAGASRASTLWQQQTKGDEKAAKEASRLFSLQMAMRGIDWEGENKRVREGNVDRKYSTQVANLERQYQNEADVTNTKTREYLINNEYDNRYISAIDQANVTKFSMTMRMMEANAEMSRAELLGQHEWDLKRFLYYDEKATKQLEEGDAKAVQAMVNTIGLPPIQQAIQTKNEGAVNAYQGAAYMYKGNKPAANNYLARELVLSGSWDLIDDPKERAKVQQLAQVDKEVAASAVGAMLNDAESKSPGQVLRVAAALSAKGHPLGTLFVNNLDENGRKLLAGLMQPKAGGR